jgi:hypothetical protein
MAPLPKPSPIPVLGPLVRSEKYNLGVAAFTNPGKRIKIQMVMIFMDNLRMSSLNKSVINFSLSSF